METVRLLRALVIILKKNKLPTPAQCKKLMKIINKAEDKGYVMPES